MQCKNKKNTYRKKIVRLNLILAISLLSCFIFANNLRAETVETIFLNKNLRFEKIEAPPSCIGKVCFKRPNDIAVSSDGSFIVVVDSGKPDDPTIYLRKINVLSKDKEGELIPLTQASLETPLLNLSINKDNNKVLVYREPTQNENTQVQIVDLNTKTIKELTSVSSQGISISFPAFFDSEGKTLIASTLNTSQPELLFIDAENDRIINQIPLPAIAESVHVGFQNNKAVFTHLGLSSFVSTVDENNKISKIPLDAFLASSIDEFQERIIFSNFGNKAALSTTDGNHAAIVLDLNSKKLVGQILDKILEGPTISAVTPDGSEAVFIGSILDTKPPGFKAYKVNISKEGSLSLVNSLLFNAGGIVLDVDITPDQSKVLILLLKDDQKQIKVLSLKDFSKISDFVVSKDNDQSFLLLDPNGRYAVTPNTSIEPSISLITDLELGVIASTVVPNIAPQETEVPFTVNGFFDLSRFSDDIKVCFRSIDFCATSVLVSRNGLKLSGLTPKFPSPGVENVLFIAKSTLDKNTQVSKYNGIFEFVKKGVTLKDSTPPEITIFAPKESSFNNSRRVLVLGKIDGTGSEVDTKSIFVNDKQPKISFEKASLNIISFVSDIQFESDGTFEIKVRANDKSGNTQEKTVKVTIDTLIPTISANIETISPNIFKVSGTVNGTGSNVSSILVNNQKITFQEAETINFTQEVNTLPITVTVFDKAGNKNEIKISNVQTEDKLPPQITFLSPSSGQIFKEINTIPVSFTVTDNELVNEVTINDTSLTLSSNNQYSQNIDLKIGENLITITATDINGNKSSSSIKVTFIPEEISKIVEPSEEETLELLQEKEVITLPSAVEDLNETIIEEFSNLVPTGDELVDISNTVSIEISNPPPIPEGEKATVEVPELKGVEIIQVKEEKPEIPKGFSFGTEVAFTESNNDAITTQKDKPNTTLLIDSTGRTFVVGFAFFREVEDLNVERKYKFQTTNGKPFELITTFSVPLDAQEGDAKISILGENQSLATIEIKIVPQKEVRIKKKPIAKPIISESIEAALSDGGSELTLKIKGKNFIGKSDFLKIDGKLQKLASKASFTNVTFNPSTGIKIKKLKLLKNKTLLLKAKIQEEFIPGKVVFNVITPKGSDNGAIIFPDPLVDGDLEATANAEETILED